MKDFICINYAQLQRSSTSLGAVVQSLESTMSSMYKAGAALAQAEGMAFVEIEARRLILVNLIEKLIVLMQEKKEVYDIYREGMASLMPAIDFSSDVRINMPEYCELLTHMDDLIRNGLEAAPITSTSEQYWVWHPEPLPGRYEEDIAKYAIEEGNGATVESLRNDRRQRELDKVSSIRSEVYNQYIDYILPFFNKDAAFAGRLHIDGSPMTQDGFNAQYAELKEMYGKLMPGGEPNWLYLRGLMETPENMVSDAMIGALTMMYEKILRGIEVDPDKAAENLTLFVQCSYINFRDMSGAPVGPDYYKDNKVYGELSPVFLKLTDNYRKQNIPWITEQAMSSIAAIYNSYKDGDSPSSVDDELYYNSAWKSNNTFLAKQYGVQLMTNIVQFCSEGEGRGTGFKYDPKGGLGLIDQNKHLKVMDFSIEPIKREGAVGSLPYDFKITTPSNTIEMYQFRDPDSLSAAIAGSTTDLYYRSAPKANTETAEAVGKAIAGAFIGKIPGASWVVSGAEIIIGHNENATAEAEAKNRLKTEWVSTLYRTGNVYGAVSLVNGEMMKPDLIFYDRDHLDSRVEKHQSEGGNGYLTTEKFEELIHFNFEGCEEKSDLHEDVKNYLYRYS